MSTKIREVVSASPVRQAGALVAPQELETVAQAGPQKLEPAGASGLAQGLGAAPRDPRATDWANLMFLGGLHAVALVGLLVYTAFWDLRWLHLALAVGGLFVTTFAISAGYHRLFAHRSYETGPVLRFLLLAFGAAAFQNSALEWASKHRRHHRHVDTDRDPYNANRGLWYSHVGWVLERGLSDPKPLISRRTPWFVFRSGTTLLLHSRLAACCRWVSVRFLGTRLAVCFLVAFGA